MIMIKLQDIALRRGTQLLFQGVNQELHAGEKIGLVGDNGSGKTSLLALFRGELVADDGDLFLPQDVRISHVAQETPDDQRSAVDHVLDGDTEFRYLESEIAGLEDHGNESAANLYSRMQDIDGYSAPARAAKLLSGLGFTTNVHQQPTNSFSGRLAGSNQSRQSANGTF